MIMCLACRLLWLRRGKQHKISGNANGPTIEMKCFRITNLVDFAPNYLRGLEKPNNAVNHIQYNED